MNWSGVRAATAVGALALAVQGVLLVVAARGDGALALPWRWTLACLLLLVVGAALARRRERGSVPVLAATFVGSSPGRRGPEAGAAGTRGRGCNGRGGFPRRRFRRRRFACRCIHCRLLMGGSGPEGRVLGDALVRAWPIPPWCAPAAPISVSWLRCLRAGSMRKGPMPRPWRRRSGATACAWAGRARSFPLPLGRRQRRCRRTDCSPIAGSGTCSVWFPRLTDACSNCSWPCRDPSVAWRGAYVVVEPSALRVEPGVL